MKTMLIFPILLLFLAPVSAQTGGIANSIMQMLPEESGIWTATNQGIVWWDIEHVSHRIFTTQDGLPSDYCSSIARSEDDGIWAVIDNRYITRFDGSTWEMISEDTPINGQYIYELSFDNEGDLWVYSNSGIYRKTGDTWNIYTNDNGLAGYPSGMYIAPNGDVWVTHLTWCIDNCPTSGHGVSHFDGEKWEIFDTGNGLLDNRTRGVCFSDDGRVWVLSIAGFSVYDGESWVSDDTFGFGYADEFVCLPDSTVYVAQPAGVYRLKNGKWSMYSLNDIMLTNRIVTLFADTENRLWVGSWDGVSMFDGSKWAVMGTESGWGARYYHSIIQQTGGTVWIASHNGLFSWDGARSVIYRTEGITGVHEPESDSLPVQVELSANTPNPFNPSTLIPFALSADSRVTIRIFDIAGQFVTEIFDGYLPAGSHQVRWNAGEYASGIYFCRLTAGNTVRTQKMMLLR